MVWTGRLKLEGIRGGPGPLLVLAGRLGGLSRRSLGAQSETPGIHMSLQGFIGASIASSEPSGLHLSLQGDPRFGHRFFDAHIFD